MAPKKTFSLFIVGRHSDNLFHSKFDNEIMVMTVGDLRKALLPSTDLSLKTRSTDYFSFVGCAILGIFMILIFTPIFIFFSLFGLLTRGK